MTPVEISAGNLHLRPWTEHDADDLVAGMSDPEAVRWTPTPVPYTREDALQRITEVYPQVWEAGTGGSFNVLDATTARSLGWVGLFGVADGAGEIGWSCWPHARGRGVITDAVAAVCRWGFAAFELEVIHAVIAVGNWPSRAVAHKCGFTVEGVSRLGMAQRGRRIDAWTASLLATDEMTDTRPLPAPPVLSDGVVTLRAFRPDDAAAVARACDDPETAAWLPVPVPYRLEDGRAYVDEVCPAGWADGSAATFAVVDAGTDELLGDISLKLPNRHPLRFGEVGYWTAPWARGRGVASRATQLVSRWGLQELGLNRVELLADLDNVASVRAAEKAGFVREGTARRARPQRDGTGRDMALLSLTASDLGTDH
jgi:RimJ/RimL family protein N-acetyltransferase